MTELNIGQEIDIEQGGKAKVTGILGSGGQGVVYSVEYNSTAWALK